MKASTDRLWQVHFSLNWFFFLFAFSFIIMPHVYAAVNEAEAKMAAYQYCEEQFGYPKNQQEIYDFTSRKGGGWAFGIKAKEIDGTTTAIIRGEMDKSGKLLNLQARENISLFEQLLEDLRRGERSYENMYEFKQKWELRFGQLSEEQLSEIDSHRNFPFRAFVIHDIRLPSTTDIPYEQAKEKAKQAILALPGWTQEMVDLIRIKLEVYHVPIHSDRPVYQFIFDEASDVIRVEAFFTGDTYTYNGEKLEKEERRVFGNVRLSSVSVRIDAQTGEHIGDIVVRLAPDYLGDAINLILNE